MTPAPGSAARGGVASAARRVAGAQPLTKLIDRYAESLRAAGRTEEHVTHQTGRARRAFTACRFRTWSDLDAHKLVT